MDSSLIAAFASCASCAVSILNLLLTRQLTRYTTQAAHTLESEKLFFQAKAEAYHVFLRSASDFAADPSAENALKLNTDCTYAVLFSSSKTQDALSLYGKCLVQHQSDPSSVILTTELVQSQVAAMNAMKDELSTTMHSATPQ